MTSYSMFENTVDGILKLPKYGILTGRIINIKGLLQRLFSRVLDFLTGLIDRLFKNVPEYNARTIAVVFLIVGIAVLITTGVLIAVHFVKKKRSKMLSDSIFHELANQQLNFEGCIAKSDAHLLGGRIREALRYRYLALLLHLSDKLVVNIYAVKTDKQLKNEVKANAPEIYERFGRIADTFNYSWFGYKPITDEIKSNFLSEFDFLTGKGAAE